MRVFVLFFVLALVATGCTQEDLTSKFVSKHEGEYQVYVVYSDGTEMGEPGPFTTDMNALHAKYAEKMGNLNGMYDVPDVKKFFDIQEFPTILVFNTEDLVFKTSSLTELEQLLAKDYIAGRTN